MDTAAESQAPRSRPRHRRAEIAENAGNLFSDRGFHAVRMEDIAEASNITARALYRHYDSKQGLLSHVLLADQQRLIDTFTALAEQPTDSRGVDATLAALCEAALDSRRLSVLWQREARHLDADDYRQVRQQARWLTTQVETLVVKRERNDLDEAAADIRSWSVASILTAPWIYGSGLSRRRLARDLAAAAKRVISAPLADAADDSARVEVGRASISRREQLIQAASSAFRDKGFAGVSIDDIGSQLGIAGPALYRYFDNKAEILVAILSRLDEWLALEMTRAMRTSCADEDVLAHVVHGYIHIALEATDLLAVSLTERLYLPAAVSERFDRVKADYLAEWQRWMAVARPELPDARAATLVQAAKAVVDDCVRIPHLRQYERFPAELTRSVLATLGLPAAGQ
jgi:AcrR family transcriptional regulator